jgi:uncharacterized RDD family membrane protein YckC
MDNLARVSTLPPQLQLIAMDYNSPTPTPPATPSVDPYAPPAAPVAAPVYQTGPQTPLAERGSRLLAQILDGLSALPGGICLGIALAGANPETGAMTSGGAVLAGIGGLYFLALLIANLRLLAKEGQSYGKKWAKVRIVRNDGSKASFGRIFGLRYVVNGLIGAIPLLGSLYSLVDILFIFRQDRRCIHDLIADTKVVVA